MAADMQREVGLCPGSDRSSVTIGEHMYADKINHGLANRLSFQATFGNEASAELDELRRTFLVKAFQRRQEALLRHLLAQGHEPTAHDARANCGNLPLDEHGAKLRARYIEKRDICAGTDEPRAFVDADGNPLKDLPDLSADLGTRIDQRRVQRCAVPRTAGRPVQRRW